MSFNFTEAAPWLVGASILMFAGSLFILPLFLISMPHDYFVHCGPRLGWLSRRHPVIRLTALAAKNLIGVVLLVAGFVMLFVPGQGVITILAGIFLMDLPGKRRFERSLLRRRGVLATLNAVRARAGRPAFLVPDESKGP